MSTLELDIIDFLDQPHVSAINAYLYIGSAEAITSEKHHFDAILSIITPASYSADYIISVTPHTKSHLYINLTDTSSADFSPHWERIYDFIHKHTQKGCNVLIHCLRGRSRSATAAIYYVMRSQGITLMDAVKIVKKARPIIRPNDHFIRQLVHEWEKQK